MGKVGFMSFLCVSPCPPKKNALTREIEKAKDFVPESGAVEEDDRDLFKWYVAVPGTRVYSMLDF